MSEIKFACPHCAQHVACDSDYADMCIVCPGCAKPMMVPIINATDAAHPKLVLVAATPAPRQKFRSRIPALDPWTEDAWEKHAAEMPVSNLEQPLSCLIPVLMLFPLISVILTGAMGASVTTAKWVGITAGLGCTGLAGWLSVQKMQGHPVTRAIVGTLVMLGLMGMQLGVLGTAGCCASID